MASQLDITVDLHNDVQQATNVLYEPQLNYIFQDINVETKDCATQTISS